MGQEEVPEPGGACLGLELLQNRRLLPAARCELGLERTLVRVHVLVHERLHALQQLFHLGRVFEIHGGANASVPRPGCRWWGRSCTLRPMTMRYAVLVMGALAVARIAAAGQCMWAQVPYSQDA